jgi:hypothetical protein
MLTATTEGVHERSAKAPGKAGTPSQRTDDDEDGNPSSHWDGLGPVLHDDGGGGEVVGRDDEVLEEVVVSDGCEGGQSVFRPHPVVTRAHSPKPMAGSTKREA